MVVRNGRKGNKKDEDQLISAGVGRRKEGEDNSGRSRSK
jgi:hypothetical protein